MIIKHIIKHLYEHKRYLWSTPKGRKTLKKTWFFWRYIHPPREKMGKADKYLFYG
jgi:hypothetical protein